MKSSDVALGSDPEIFIEKSDGTLFPAFAFLPSKYEPLKTKEEGCNYYWDGFQAEFNITPNLELNDCLKSVRFGLKAILRRAQEVDPTARLSTKTVVETPLDMLRTLPPEFVEFGCMPSFNAYGINGMSLDGINCPHRFAGGHIHFGISQYDKAMDAIPYIVRALDAVVGVTCVSLFENFDNPIRRRYYGLPGEHRLPPHGLEYRPLSDAWLFNPKLAGFVLELARRVLVQVVNGKYAWSASEDEVIDCMIRSDVGLARKILERNANAFKLIGVKTSIDIMQPVEKSVDMKDIAENWNI
jgi:Phage phiEco32-like COOH.NH2 ligase-type 2